MGWQVLLKHTFKTASPIMSGLHNMLGKEFQTFYALFQSFLCITRRFTLLSVFLRLFLPRDAL